jgi:hypothetical protein
MLAQHDAIFSKTWRERHRPARQTPPLLSWDPGWGDRIEAECARLLSGLGVLSPLAGSNPAPSATIQTADSMDSFRGVVYSGPRPPFIENWPGSRRYDALLHLD